MSFRHGVALVSACGPRRGPGGSAARPAGDAKAGETKAASAVPATASTATRPTSRYPKLAGQHEATSPASSAVQVRPAHESDHAGLRLGLSEQDMHDVGAYFAGKKILTGVGRRSCLARGEARYKGGDAKLGCRPAWPATGPTAAGDPVPSPQVGGQWTDYVAPQASRNGTTARSGAADDRAKIMPEIARKLSEGHRRRGVLHRGCTPPRSRPPRPTDARVGGHRCRRPFSLPPTRRGVADRLHAQAPVTV